MKLLVRSLWDLLHLPHKSDAAVMEIADGFIFLGLAGSWISCITFLTALVSLSIIKVTLQERVEGRKAETFLQPASASLLLHTFVWTCIIYLTQMLVIIIQNMDCLHDNMNIFFPYSSHLTGTKTTKAAQCARFSVLSSKAVWTFGSRDLCLQEEYRIQGMYGILILYKWYKMTL